MKFTLFSIISLLTVALISALPVFDSFSSSEEHHVDKRMLSQLFKHPEQPVDIRIISENRLAAIDATHKLIIHQLQTVKISGVSKPRLLLWGNTPSYIEPRFTQEEKSQYGANIIPISGISPLSKDQYLDPDSIRAFSENVLKNIDMSSMDSIILVDVSQTGSSIDKDKNLLTECGKYLSAHYGQPEAPWSNVHFMRLADEQDRGTTFMDPLKVPLFGDPIYVPIKGFLNDLAGIEGPDYPRLVANYPNILFETPPEEVAKQQQLEEKGRTQIYNSIRDFRPVEGRPIEGRPMGIPR